MRRSQLMQIVYWCSAMALLLSSHNGASAQTKDTNQSTGTTAQQPAPTASRPKAPQQDTRAPSQTPSKTPRDSGIKVDPVQAARTIIDIFGKKKKKPTAQPASAPQPEIPAPEPTVTAPPPAPVVTKPAPKTVLVPRAPSKAISPKPSARPANAVVSEPVRPSVEQATVQQQTQPADMAPSTSPPPVDTPSESVEPSTFEAVKPINDSWPGWPLIAALAALAALLAAAVKWFFFPTARIDLEYETGESRLAKVASPFVGAPEATFDLELEWGAPSAPNFQLLQAGGQS